MLRKYISGCLCFYIFTASGFALAQQPIQSASAQLSPEQRGFAVAERNDMTNRGFGDNVVDQEMTLYDSNGQSSKRTLRSMVLEVDSRSLGDKSISIFETPADIKGMAVLSHAKILDPDDQWLYLPALKRVKRIASANKSGSFAGSEFSYEDFTLDLYKFNYKYIGEEPCPNAQGLICDVVESRPKYENSGYSKLVSWIDQTVYQTQRIDFYDRKGSRLKTLDFLEYKQYPSKYWRAHRLNIKNHLTGKRTELLYSNYKFKTGLKDSDFVKEVLDRMQ